MSDPIVFDLDDVEEDTRGKVIDFTAHRQGLVRRLLSHDVIRADDDLFDFALFAVAGRRYR